MSARSRPTSGYASSEFSTLIANTGRSGASFPGARSSPVRGHGAGRPVTLSTMSWIGPGACPVNASMPTPATAAAAITPIRAFPRLVIRTLEPPSQTADRTNGPSLEGPRAEPIPGAPAPQTPGAISMGTSHLLEAPDPIGQRRGGGEKLLPPA